MDFKKVICYYSVSWIFPNSKFLQNPKKKICSSSIYGSFFSRSLVPRKKNRFAKLQKHILMPGKCIRWARKPCDYPSNIRWVSGPDIFPGCWSKGRFVKALSWPLNIKMRLFPEYIQMPFFVFELINNFNKESNFSVLIIRMWGSWWDLLLYSIFWLQRFYFKSRDICFSRLEKKILSMKSFKMYESYDN